MVKERSLFHSANFAATDLELDLAIFLMEVDILVVKAYIDMEDHTQVAQVLYIMA